MGIKTKLIDTFEKAIEAKACKTAEAQEYWANIENDYKTARINLLENLVLKPTQVNNQHPPIYPEDFIKMFLKKKEEYIKLTSQDLEPHKQILLSERQRANNELKSFLRWLIEQTGQFKRLNAERKELLSQADDKDREIRKYIENRWVEEAK
jgi:hypothetical protein